jgi:hypothetical protein
MYAINQAVALTYEGTNCSLFIVRFVVVVHRYTEISAGKSIYICSAGVVI